MVQIATRMHKEMNQAPRITRFTDCPEHFRNGDIFAHRLREAFGNDAFNRSYQNDAVCELVFNVIGLKNRPFA